MSTSHNEKPQSAAQRASEANRIAQMKINEQLGRHMPARDPNAPRQTYEERHGRPTFKR